MTGERHIAGAKRHVSDAERETRRTARTWGITVHFATLRGGVTGYAAPHIEDLRLLVRVSDLVWVTA